MQKLSNFTSLSVVLLSIFNFSIFSSENLNEAFSPSQSSYPKIFIENSSEEIFIDRIGIAKKSILYDARKLYSRKIALALEKAKAERGILIKIISDNSGEKDHKSLIPFLASITEVVINDSKEFTPSNTMIIDNLTIISNVLDEPVNKVTPNLPASANIFLVNDEIMAKYYENLWNIRYSKSRPINLKEKKKR